MVHIFYENELHLKIRNVKAVVQCLVINFPDCLCKILRKTKIQFLYFTTTFSNLATRIKDTVFYTKLWSTL